MDLTKLFAELDLTSTGKPMLRARRRMDLARMKARALRIYPHDKLARSAEHLKVCSCECCGNPRNHWGEKKISELRHEEMTRHQIRELTEAA